MDLQWIFMDSHGFLKRFDGFQRLSRSPHSFLQYEAHVSPAVAELRQPAVRALAIDHIERTFGRPETSPKRSKYDEKSSPRSIFPTVSGMKCLEGPLAQDVGSIAATGGR